VGAGVAGVVVVGVVGVVGAVVVAADDVERGLAVLAPGFFGFAEVPNRGAGRFLFGEVGGRRLAPLVVGEPWPGLVVVVVGLVGVVPDGVVGVVPDGVVGVGVVGGAVGEFGG
jgi:hypothetical protein